MLSRQKAGMKVAGRRCPHWVQVTDFDVHACGSTARRPYCVASDEVAFGSRTRRTAREDLGHGIR
jgi:hypothetical protein